MEPVRLDTDGLPFSSWRKFQMWGYVVSHGQLLLRANKTSDPPSTTVEILFKDTRFVCLPGVMEGLTVRRGDKEIVQRHLSDLSQLELPYGVNVFEVGGQGWNGFVVAGSIWMHEDDSEYYHHSKLGLILPGTSPFGELPDS